MHVKKLIHPERSRGVISTDTQMGTDGTEKPQGVIPSECIRERNPLSPKLRDPSSFGCTHDSG